MSFSHEEIPTMRQAFFDALSNWLADDPLGFVVLADISASQLAPLRETYPDRVLNVGIREQTAIGVAAGLSLQGAHPLVHTYAPFLVERPLEMIKNDLLHQELGATLVSIGASYDEPGYGRTHQCPEDVVLLSALGRCEISIPGHPDEVGPLLRQAVASPRVNYLRLTIASNLSAVRNTTDRMVEVRQGSRAVVIAVGPMLDSVLEATQNLDVSVYYTTIIRPFDAETVRVATTRCATVILVEPYLAGTSTAEVSRALSDRPHRLLALGVENPDLHRYGTIREHDIAHGLDVVGLRTAISNFLDGGEREMPV